MTKPRSTSTVLIDLLVLAIVLVLAALLAREFGFDIAEVLR